MIADRIASLHDPLMQYRDLLAFLLLPAALIIRRAIPSERVIPLAAALAAAVVCVTVCTSVGYLAMPGYVDHVEAGVVAVSWWFREGHALYPAWNEGQGLYGLLYGPLLFEISGAALSVWPSILMSKIPGFCAFWLAAVILAWSLRPLLPSARSLLLPLGAYMIVAATFWNYCYWVRSEPYLLLLAALSLLVERRLNPAAAAVAIGFFAGLSINLKVHAVMYILPFAVALLPRDGGKHWCRTTILGIAGALPALVLPFLHPNVSFENYTEYLLFALRNDFDIPLLMENLRFAFVLIIPVLVLTWRHVQGEQRLELVMGWSYVGAILGVCILAGKQSGPHHLLPFLPAFAFFLVMACRANQLSRADGRVLATSFLALLVSYMPGAAISLNDLRYAWGHMENERMALREVKSLYRSYPHSVMGVGDSASYRLSYYRVVGIFAGAPDSIDLPAWMDLQLAGVSDAAPEQLLRAHGVSHWIVPKGGAPFSAASPYHGEPLFSGRFREMFHGKYVMVRGGVYYDVWAAGPSGPDTPSHDVEAQAADW